MANDIFGYDRKASPLTLYSSEASVITIAGSRVFLGQEVRVTYTQQVQEVYEIGSSDLFWIGGRPSGVGSIGRLVGPGTSMVDAQQKLQLCGNQGTLSIQLAQKCDKANFLAGAGIDLDTNVSAGNNGGKVTVDCSGVVMVEKTWVLNSTVVAITENLVLRIAKVSETVA